MTEFALSLKSSGHGERFRVEVFDKALARYKLELANHNAGTADIYRSRQERNRQVEAKGGKASKDTWFRQKRSSGETVTSVLRVPFTKGSLVKKEAENVFNCHKPPKGLYTQVLEGGGSKLEHSLMRSDPFPRPSCHRTDCPMSFGDQGCKDSCFQDHVNYTIMCTRCEKARREWEVQAESESDAVPRDQVPPPKFMYCGESCRGCYKRFGEHIDLYKSKKNFMWQHVEEVHAGVVGEDPHKDFFMKRVAVDPDPIRRILRESARICRLRQEETEGASNIHLMNGKDEFFGVKIVQPAFVQD